MKKSLVLSTIVCVFSFLISINARVAAAYELDWVSIEHRVYEDGRIVNRLQFAMKDDSGNYIDRKNIVTSVILKYPPPNNNVKVNLSPLSFDPLLDYISGYFDTANGEWVYNPVLPLSGFYADIQDPLVIGTYTLEVTTEDAVTHSKPDDFDFLLNLPFSSSRTFQINSDSDGNVYWMWDVPKKLLSLAKTYNLEVRAGVGSYDNGFLTALIYPSLPVHMGFCFIPNNIYQYMISKGDEIEFFFHARSTNSNARSYSNSIKVTNFSAPLEIAPKKSAVVVPLY